MNDDKPNHEPWRFHAKAAGTARLMPAGTLTQLTVHACDTPREIPRHSPFEALWTCPVCTSQWSWRSGAQWTCESRTYQVEVLPQ